MKTELSIEPPYEGAKILCAVSGGADSVALLALLRELYNKGRIGLYCAHFEHGIRGDESRRDADFVKGLCGRWEIPLIMGAADVPGLSRSSGEGLETAARTARYAFLRKAKEETGSDFIALAHHLDDQAETVLMHILRGAGLRGAGGMREISDGLWRPLLSFRKAALIAYLTKRNIPWREDATNAAADNPRNILRLRAMPLLEEVYPGAAEALGRFARLARLDDGLLSRIAQDYLRKNAFVQPCGFEARLASGTDDAVLLRVIRLLTGVSGEDCFRALEMWRRGNGYVRLSCGVAAECRQGTMYFVTKDVPCAETPLVLPGTTVLPGIGRITAEGAANEPSRDPLCQVLDEDSLRGAVLRTRRDGDFIRPFGMAGKKSLGDYFTDRHYPRALRDGTMLIAKDNEILWAAGVGISESARLREGSRALRLRAEPAVTRWEA